MSILLFHFTSMKELIIKLLKREEEKHSEK